MMSKKEVIRSWQKDEFNAYIQPIVNSKDWEIYGGELLMRRRTVDGQLIFPGEFIDNLESTGLLPVITRKMMLRAVRNLISSTIRDFHLSVNVTPELLVDSAFIQDCLSFSEMDDVKLILEFTEKRPFQVNKSIERALTILADRSVEFALDDFGTGCSTLSYLKFFPIRYIKIDKIFSDDISWNTNSRYIIESITNLAIKMNIVTVAEGVETQEQAYSLRRLGIDYLQGYYFGEPQSLIKFCNEHSKRAPQ